MKNNEKDLISLHDTLTLLLKEVAETITEIEFKVKNKFDLYKQYSLDRLEYYKRIYKQEKIIFSLYFIAKENPFIFLISENGNFFQPNLYDFYDDKYILSKYDFEIVNSSNSHLLNKIKLWLQKSRYEILYIDTEFEREFDLYYKPYLLPIVEKNANI